jgi:nicotinamide-nucleotide amidase
MKAAAGPSDPRGPEPAAWLAEDASRLMKALLAGGHRLVAAESCTGGLIAAALTELPGSSAVLWGSIVTYSLEAKQGLLEIPPALLAEKGPVSAETALAMLAGALERSRPLHDGAARVAGGAVAGGADLAVAVTGWAGPEAPAAEGGPGRVVVAWAKRSGKAWFLERRFPGERRAVRLQAAALAMNGAARLASGEAPSPDAMPAELSCPAPLQAGNDD